MIANKWKQNGKIFLWKYKDNPKNYRGFHLTADSVGVKSLLELIDLMLQSETDAKRTIQLNTVTKNELRVPNCSNKAISFSKLLIDHRKDDENLWKLNSNDSVVSIKTGEIHLVALKEGLLDIARDQGDYFIGEGKQELWFWWHIKS